MLAEDTRQSLAIEGHFATEEELEAVLGGRKLYSHARLALPEQRRGRVAASGSGNSGTNETKR
jgi:hypothetical protein